MLKLLISLLLIGYVNSLSFDKNVDLDNPNVNKIVINNDILYIYDKLTIKILSLKNINCFGYICNNKFKQVICHKDTQYNHWNCDDNIYNIKLVCTDDCKLYSNYLIHYINYLNYFKSNKSIDITKNILSFIYLSYIILITILIILYQLKCFFKYIINKIEEYEPDIYLDDIYARRRPSKN
jgi:hypothetical protein